MNRCIVTIIHGTWAPNAEWARPTTSILRKHLAAEIAGVRFRRLLWTGTNNHASRLEAADRLRAHLRRRIDRDPDAAHVLVAHSHGGNVAVYAMRDQAIRERVAGVACLATPFITCRPVSIHRTLAITRWVAAIAACVLMFAILLPLPTWALTYGAWWYHDNYLPWNSATLYGRWPVGLVLIGAHVLLPLLGLLVFHRLVIKWLMPLILERFPEYLLDRQKRVVSQLATPQLDGVRVLVQYVRGPWLGWRDEAGLHLVVINLLTLLPHVLFRTAATLVIGLGVTYLVIAPVVLVFLYVADYLDSWRLVERIGLVLPVVLGTSLVVAIATPLLCAIAIGWGWMLRGTGLGLGGEAIFDSWLVSTPVTRQPAGCASPVMQSFRVRSRLKHSGLYTDPIALSELTAWVTDACSAWHASQARFAVTTPPISTNRP